MYLDKSQDIVWGITSQKYEIGSDQEDYNEGRHEDKGEEERARMRVKLS